MRISLIWYIFLLGHGVVNAQIHKSRKNPDMMACEVQLLVDNDVFTLDLNQDQYYSNGIYASYRQLSDSTQRAKTILTFRLNHRMYTPSWIGWSKLEEFDRPYAGVLSATFGKELYYHSGQYLRLFMELGWLGEGSGVGRAQVQWHNFFGMPEPKGWDFQIEDAPVVNLDLAYVKSLSFQNGFSLSSESFLKAGTLFNQIEQNLLFQLGRPLPVNQSAYLGSILGRKKSTVPTKGTIEAYGFYSPGLKHIVYDATLEGNLIGKPSIYVVESIPWIWQHRLGALFSWPLFDLGITYVWQSKANKEASSHDYIGIRVNQRF